MASTYRATLLSSTVVPMLVGVALVGVSFSGSQAQSDREAFAERDAVGTGQPVRSVRGGQPLQPVRGQSM